VRARERGTSPTRPSCRSLQQEARLDHRVKVAHRPWRLGSRHSPTSTSPILGILRAPTGTSGRVENSLVPMKHRSWVWTVLLPVAALAVACAPNGGPSSARSTSTSIAAFTHPSVTVTPSSALTTGQQVQVHVSGFEITWKVYLSECSSAAAANKYGCGEQLAAQPFIMTDESRSGTGTFSVEPTASGKPYDIADAIPCTTNCVLLATGGGGFAVAPLSFAG
jgi:hypothetical protein